jgi:hypothetical protein
MSIVYNGSEREKPPISDTSYSLYGPIRGLLATVGSVNVEGAEGGEERKELELENL